MVQIGFNLDRISTEFYDKYPGNVVVIEETAKDGKAELTCVFENGDGKEYIGLVRSEGKHLLKYMNNQECADGIILESDLTDRTKANIYIIELKSKMNSTKWGKVKGQFRGATIRALAFASSLGITQVAEIRYFTAYVDSICLDEVAESIQTQERIEGMAALKSFSSVSQRELQEWEKGEVKIFDDQPDPFPHQQILLLPGPPQNLGRVSIS